MTWLRFASVGEELGHPHAALAAHDANPDAAKPIEQQVGPVRRAGPEGAMGALELGGAGQVFAGETRLNTGSGEASARTV